MTGLRPRPRRKGPGPAATALALLAVVVGIAYLYYETPGAFGQNQATVPARHLAPVLAWTQEVSFPAAPDVVSLGVDAGRILVVGSSESALWARWFDRFGFAAAEAEVSAPFAAWTAAGSTLVVARPASLPAPAGAPAPAGPAAAAGAAPVEVLFLHPDNLPGGQAWSTERGAAGASIAPMGADAAAVAVYGEASGPDLHPDVLAHVERVPTGDPSASPAGWRPAWSAVYETGRLLQIVAGSDLVGALVLDPDDARPYRVELRRRDGRLAWQLAVGEDGLLLAAVVTVGGTAAVAALAGSEVLLLDQDGVRWRAPFDPPPAACWPAGAGQLACTGAGRGVPWFAFVDSGGRPGPRLELAPGSLIRPLPGAGVLVVEGRRLRAWGPSGELWSAELPFEPLAVTVTDHGLAAGSGSRLAWLNWPGADHP